MHDHLFLMNQYEVLDIRPKTSVHNNAGITIMRVKIIFYIFFLFTIFNYLYANESEMWEFSKNTTKKKEPRNNLTGQFLLLGIIRTYQIILSEQQGDACNFTPSCSHYAYKSTKHKGVIIGSLMAIDRLQRCNPWSWNYLNIYYQPKWVDGRGYRLYDPP